MNSKHSGPIPAGSSKDSGLSSLARQVNADAGSLVLALLSTSFFHDEDWEWDAEDYEYRSLA